ncbi:MAG: hypothetical protein ACYDGN_16490 [Acidimicrobiales bacterium]
MSVEQAGLQGRTADRRAGRCNRWLGLGGVDLGEQILVVVEETAVDACWLGDPRDEPNSATISRHDILGGIIHKYGVAA